MKTYIFYILYIYTVFVSRKELIMGLNINGLNPILLQGRKLDLGTSENNESKTRQQWLFPPQGVVETDDEVIIEGNDNLNGSIGELPGVIGGIIRPEPPINTIPKPIPKPMPPVDDQVNINSRGLGIWGDPHFQFVNNKTGKMVDFTHKGKAGESYNLFKGDGLQVNGTYEKWGRGNATVVKLAEIKAGKDTITFDENGKVGINGVPAKPDAKGTVTLQDGTKLTIDKDKKTVIIQSKENDAKIKLEVKNSTNGNYINIDPDGKFSDLGGILGTAIKEGRALSEEECNKFDLSSDPAPVPVPRPIPQPPVVEPQPFPRPIPQPPVAKPQPIPTPIPQPPAVEPQPFPRPRGIDYNPFL
jgi:hypothetical protein